MNSLYTSIGITKQAFHQQLNRDCLKEQERANLLPIVNQIRQDHPTMGCRDMYYKLGVAHMGRDAFERFCKDEGLMVERFRNWRRTTDSSGVVRFGNLLPGLEIRQVNQVWQSDITYFDVQGKFYYITFIIDAYSRRIVGHSTSRRLLTSQTTLPALRMALKLREGLDLTGLIFHSDGGGQYYEKEFLQLIGRYSLVNSMCEYAWENGKAERINGVIKNNYLIHRIIKSFEDLQKEVDRSVQLYNFEKPHIGLQRKTPVNFENLVHLNSIPAMNQLS
jgi:transposase InsO family protein